MYEKFPANHEKVDKLAAFNKKLFLRGKLLQLIVWMRIKNMKRLVSKETTKRRFWVRPHLQKRKEFSQLDAIVGILPQVFKVIGRLWSHCFWLDLCVEVSPSDANDGRQLEKIEMLPILTILMICVGDSLEGHIFMFVYIVRIFDGRGQSWSPILVIVKHQMRCALYKV